MTQPEMKLTSEQRERVLNDIEVAEQTLNNLYKFERIGQDISEQKRILEDSIKKNKAILAEFS